MRLWRISAFPGLTGAGGLYDSGRWHSKGHPIIYVSEHPALAMVESMAHMRLRLSNIPLTLKLITIEVADGASVSPSPALPGGWQANESTTRALGDAWVTAKSGLLMQVPSALLADARNYLVNPGHPEAASHLRETRIEPFWFDKRYLR